MHKFKYENQEMIYGGFLWATPPTQLLRSALRRLSCLLVSWPGCPFALVTPLRNSLLTRWRFRTVTHTVHTFKETASSLQTW